MGRANGHASEFRRVARVHGAGQGFAVLAASYELGTSQAPATAPASAGDNAEDKRVRPVSPVINAAVDDAVIVPLYRLGRDPDMAAHFGHRLCELDDLTDEEFTALRDYARQAEAAVRAAGREPELLAALVGISAAVHALREPLTGRCRHCWCRLPEDANPGARYDSENCRAAAAMAAERRGRWGSGSAADETLAVLDEAARLGALAVIARDLVGPVADRLLAPFMGVLVD